MKRVLLITFALLGIRGTVMHLSLVANTLTAVPPADMDASAIWFQAERIRSDDRIYEPIPDYGPHYMAYETFPEARPYPIDNSPYLPLAGSVTALLPRVRLVTFQRIWAVVLLLAVLGFAAALAQLSKGRVDVIGVIAWTGAIHLTPGAFHAIRMGNIEPILWLLFALAILHRRATGAVLAAMTLTKPHALWPLAFGVIRDRTVRRSALLGLLGAVGVVAAATGPMDLIEASGDWLRIVPGTLGQGSFAGANYSASFGVLRIVYSLGVWDYEPGPILDTWPRVWLTVAQITAPLAAGYASRRWDLRWQLCLVMITALLASPLCWRFYLTVGWVPVALWLATASEAVLPGWMSDPPPGSGRSELPRTAGEST